MPKLKEHNNKSIIMAKDRNAEKTTKKEPQKTLKEKRADKKVKQEQKRRSE